MSAVGLDREATRNPSDEEAEAECAGLGLSVIWVAATMLAFAPECLQEGRRESYTHRPNPPETDRYQVGRRSPHRPCNYRRAGRDLRGPEKCQYSHIGRVGVGATVHRK